MPSQYGTSLSHDATLSSNWGQPVARVALEAAIGGLAGQLASAGHRLIHEIARRDPHVLPQRNRNRHRHLGCIVGDDGRIDGHGEISGGNCRHDQVGACLSSFSGAARDDGSSGSFIRCILSCVSDHIDPGKLNKAKRQHQRNRHRQCEFHCHNA